MCNLSFYNLFEQFNFDEYVFEQMKETRIEPTTNEK